MGWTLFFLFLGEKTGFMLSNPVGKSNTVLKI
jgi:hypothetical protein